MAGKPGEKKGIDGTQCWQSEYRAEKMIRCVFREKIEKYPKFGHLYIKILCKLSIKKT